MSRTTGIILLAVLSCIGRNAPAQPTSPTLGPEETYVWSIRASHSDELLIAVGDSVDLVLLRDRCGADAGHGQKGCWDASTVNATPKWHVVASDIAAVRALPEGSWIFGRGTSGARLYALRPGATIVTATLPSGEVVSDSLWVTAAPGAVRLPDRAASEIYQARPNMRMKPTCGQSPPRPAGAARPHAAYP